jgi:DNA (cytosine-5)-methyltransferase 1
MNKLSLFSGILGDDLASEWCGIETVCCVEINEFSRRVIKKHYPNMPIIEDVRNVTKEKVKEVSGCKTINLISGGFPCQDVSTAGLRKGIKEDTRSGLWIEYARVINEFRPEWVVAENVRGLLSIDNGEGFRTILRDFANMGYNVGWCVLRASTYGAKHQRERIFIVANSYCQRFVTLSVQERIYKEVSSKRFIYDVDLFNYLQGITPICPDNLRATYGIPESMDEIKERIKALGNSVVPQQIYPIYRAIVDVENEIKNGLFDK